MDIFFPKVTGNDRFLGNLSQADDRILVVVALDREGGTLSMQSSTVTRAMRLVYSWI